MNEVVLERMSELGRIGASFGKLRVLCSTSSHPIPQLRTIYSTAAAHSKFKIKVRGCTAPVSLGPILTFVLQAVSLEVPKCEFLTFILAYRAARREGGKEAQVEAMG